ncbi:hypothetical protein V6N13_082299 [Hibiscus sabdariffa]
MLPLKLVFPQLFSIPRNKVALVVDYAWDGSLSRERWPSFFAHELRVFQHRQLHDLRTLGSRITLSVGVCDQLVWKFDIQGQFSVGKLTKLLVSSGSDEDLADCWFVWHLENISVDESKVHCVWCSIGYDEIDHIFLLLWYGVFSLVLGAGLVVVVPCVVPFVGGIPCTRISLLFYWKGTTMVVVFLCFSTMVLMVGEE